eukprot:COSAG06_NODE_1506_length_9248_cov_6.203702_3_plen_358_part_00
MRTLSFQEFVVSSSKDDLLTADWTHQQVVRSTQLDSHTYVSLSQPGFFGIELRCWAAVCARAAPRERAPAAMLASEGVINDTEEAVAAMQRSDVQTESDWVLTRKPPPQAVVLCEDPLVYYVDDFTTDEECDAIIAKATPQMKRARVSGMKDGRVSSGRTNSVAWMAAAGDEVFEAVEDKVCDLIGCRAECTESFQVIHYEEGQEYKPHLDAYDTSSPHGQNNCKRGGNRLVTTLLYLCDVEAGGTTAFTKLGVEIEPKKRRIAVFYNCLPGQAADVNPQTMHCGSPVDAGIKWAANKWIRQFPMHAERPRRLGPPPEWAQIPEVEGWGGRYAGGDDGAAEAEPEPEPEPSVEVEGL